MPQLRVAVVHDWLTGMRGGEKVLEEILALFPHAELFTLFHDRGSVSPLIEAHRIHTSPLDRLRRLSGDYRRLLPFYPWAVRRWKFDAFDLVISSSHCAAKGVVVPRSVAHLCYCHTPMRYLWDRFDDYFPPSRPLTRLAASLVAPSLRRWDVESAARVDSFIANSRFVAGRIARIYGREAEVIHPFVDDAFLEAPLDVARGDEHVILSALVPYKKVELAIEAARLSGKRLAVIGSGPLAAKLAAAAPVGVRFLGWSDRATIIATVSAAASLILPGVEDFGITPLEAMALGTPVVAYRDGGVLESVIEGESGLFFSGETPEALAAAMTLAEKTTWDRSRLRRRAAEFSRARFRQKFSAAVERVVEMKR